MMSQKAQTGSSQIEQGREETAAYASFIFECRGLTLVILIIISTLLTTAVVQKNS